MFYVATLANEKLGIGAIKTNLSGVASAFQDYGLRNPIYDETGKRMFRLQRMIRGLKKIPRFQKQKEIRKALTIDKLDRIFVELERAGATLSRQDVNMIKACLALGVYAMLRVSECTSPYADRGKFTADLHACIGDVEFVPSIEDPQFVQFNVRRSKTDPFREGIVLRVAANGSRTCPVQAMAAYFRTNSSRKRDDPLFSFLGGQSLTRASLQKWMRWGLERAGLNPKHYATHSMRSGGATSLLACPGFDIEHIKTLGRWRSDSVSRDLRDSEMLRVQASRNMASISSNDWMRNEFPKFDPSGG